MTATDKITIAHQADDVKEAALSVLDNTSKVIHEFADAKSFVAFCDEHGLLATEAKDDAFTEAGLLIAYRELLVEVLTYDQVLGHYRRLLELHPGKALHIGQDDYAVLDEDGYLYAVNKSDSETFSQAGVYDFDRSAYNTCVGGWNADTFVETWRYIEDPVFLDFAQ
jgi:hypothetical protein